MLAGRWKLRHQPMKGLTMTSDTAFGVPYAPAGVDERGYHVTCPVTRCGEKFYAASAAPCCAGVERTETGPGTFAETHSFGCPSLGGDRWFGCSDAEIARWKEEEATKEPAALYAAHYLSEHHRR